MTVESSASSVTYTGNGLTTQFSYPFLIPQVEHVEVILTTLSFIEIRLGADEYSVSGLGNDAGGFVTYPLSGAPLSAVYSLTIRRVLPLVQLADIVNQSAFYPETLEDAFDYEMMVLQQLQEQISRALILPAGLDFDDFLMTILSAESDAEIWAAAAQADAILAAYYASLSQSIALGNAASIPYSNATSGLSATNVQTAIDEVVVSIAGAGGGAAANVGDVQASAALNVPALWLPCDGATRSRTTYADLFAAITRNAVVAVSIASPAVVTWTAHGLVAGDPVSITTTGALPTGLVASTVYYVMASGLAANTFKLSAAPGGVAINTSGTQSGVHTALYAPYGRGNGSTSFNVPDLNHRGPVGYSVAESRLTLDNGSGIDGRNLGNSGGVQSVTLNTSQMPSHTHPFDSSVTVASGGVYENVPTTETGGVSTGPTNTGSTGGGAAHNNVPPGLVVRFNIYAGV